MYKENQELISFPLIKAHLYFAVVMSFIVVVAGLTYSMQFISLYPFPKIEWLSPGRIRMIHTQAIAYAWLANIFFAIVLYMLPKLTQKPILSVKFGWFCFYFYNLLILLTVVM
ncbi:MAG: cytochrome oxidase, partial [Bacteriovoracales bacterium]